MILLFNKVYLKSDHFFKGERTRVYISSRHTQSLLDAGFRDRVNFVQPVNPTLAADNYQQLLTDHFDGNEDRFFVWLLALNPSERMTIYGSIETMLRIATKFWKTLYPRMQSSDYIKLVHFTLLHHLELFSHRGTPLAELNSTQVVELHNEIKHAMDCYPELESVWDVMTPLSLTRAQRETLLKGAAIEYQLPTMLMNPTWRYSAEAKKRIVSMASKAAVEDFVMDVKYTLLANLELIHHIDPACTYDCTVDTLDQFVARNPRYTFLVDPNFSPEHMRHVLSNYDLDDLAAIRTTLGLTDVRAGGNWQPLLKSNMSFDDYVTHIVEHASEVGMLDVGEYKEKTNPIMLSYIIASYKSGDVEKIQPFTIG